MKSNLLRQVIGLLTCLWLMLVQPGMSYYWLIDPHLHAEMDAEDYGQLPDGQPLPGQPWRPPHQHPTNEGTIVTGIVLHNVFDSAFYQVVLSAAENPALAGCRSEAAVIAESVTPAPPDHPPRV
jgi:hypothetical protein